MERMKRAGFGVLTLAAALSAVFAGCRGTPVPGETAAHTRLENETRAYRPEGKRPQLPLLTVESTVGDLLAFAILNNPSVEAAFYEYAAAVEEITVERSYPDPMFELGVEIADTVEALTPALLTDPMNNWPLPVKLQLRGEAAYREAMAKRETVRAAMLETAYFVKRAWYQMWALDEEIRLTRDTVGVVDRAEKYALDRIAVGNATQQDALRAQMERDRLETSLESLADSRETVRSRMRAALGLESTAPMPDFKAALDEDGTAADGDATFAEALGRNAKLAGMRQEIMQAMALYELAGKAGVPDFSFGIEADLKGSPVPFAPRLGVQLPIWRDKITAEIAAARARAGASQSRLDAERLDLAVRFAEAAYAWREAERNAILYGERLLPKARAALEASESGYTGGITDFADLLDAQKTLLEFETERVRALGEGRIALAEMSLVIMAEWPEDAPEVLDGRSDQPGPDPARPTK
jgi:outer membrane protein TolC